MILKLLRCVAGLVSQEREKGQYREQREWTGFARKKPFMLILYLIAYVGQNHHPKTSLTLSSESDTTQLIPWKNRLLQRRHPCNLSKRGKEAYVCAQLEDVVDECIYRYRFCRMRLILEKIKGKENPYSVIGMHNYLVVL